jgi:hypothetical protein
VLISLQQVNKGYLHQFNSKTINDQKKSAEILSEAFKQSFQRKYASNMSKLDKKIYKLCLYNYQIQNLMKNKQVQILEFGFRFLFVLTSTEITACCSIIPSLTY